MTPAELQTAIAVMHGFAGGRRVQFCCKQGEHAGKWIDDFDPWWNWLLHDYRLKPEPRVRYVQITERDLSANGTSVPIALYEAQRPGLNFKLVELEVKP